MKTRLPDYFFVLALLGYFIIAMVVCPDYGVNWDDGYQRTNGLNNWEYISGQNTQHLKESTDKYHGPAFEIILIAAEKALHLKDNYDIYTFRHRVVVVFFSLSLIAFYFLGFRLFRNKWIVLAGVVMLILTPRIFAESCYNPKDIVLLGAMVIAANALLAFVENPDYKRSLFLAFSCAFALDVRIIGGLMIPVSLVMICIELKQGNLKWKDLKKKLLFLRILFTAFMILMWPILIQNPIARLLEAYAQLSNYILWLGYNRYMGQWYVSNHTPWHYHFVWIAITTPEVYLLLFIIGLVTFICRGFHTRQYDRCRAFLWLCLFIIFFPLVFRAAKHSIVLDGWRHMYFVYPFMLLIALYGLTDIYLSSTESLKWFVVTILTVGLLSSLVAIIKLHPFQYVYFNTAANIVFKPIDKQFDMDYWGISYRQGLEYILDHDKSASPIPVSFYNLPGYSNLECLPSIERQRFKAVDNIKDAQYWLNTHRMYRGVDSLIPVYSIRAQGNDILDIYQFR